MCLRIFTSYSLQWDSHVAPTNAGDMDLIPGSRIFPGGGNGNPLKYSFLGNPVDRGAWWATVYGVTKNWT